MMDTPQYVKVKNPILTIIMLDVTLVQVWDYLSGFKSVMLMELSTLKLIVKTFFQKKSTN